MLCVGRARRAGPRNLEGRIVNGNEGGLSDPFLNPGYGRSFGSRGGGGAGGLYPVELDPGLEMVIVVIPGPCCAMTTRRYGDVAVRSRKSVGWKADPVDYYLSSALFLFLRLLSFCYYRGLSHSPAIHRTTFYGSTFGFSLGNSGRIDFLSVTDEPRWTMLLLSNSTTPTDIGVPAGPHSIRNGHILRMACPLYFYGYHNSERSLPSGGPGSGSLGRALVDMTLHYVRYDAETSQSSELPVIWPRRR